MRDKRICTIILYCTVYCTPVLYCTPVQFTVHLYCTVHRRYGAPEAANKELEFENFDSVLLEFKTVFHMTGNLGRVRR